MIKVLCFDLDNTLINRQIAARCAYKHLLSTDSNGSINDEDLESYCNEIMARDDFGFVGYREIYQWYQGRYNFAKKREINEFYQIYAETSCRHATLFPWTLDVLDQLQKNYRLAIITNGKHRYQRSKLKVFPDLSWFENIIVSEEWGEHKPSSSIFLEMCRKMDVRPDEMVYIGDNLSADIDGARSVGMPCIWINNFHHVNSRKCKEVKDIRSLLTLDLSQLEDLK